MFKKISIVALFLMASVWTSSAFATTVPVMSFSELTEQTSYVFVGKVVEVKYKESDSDPLTVVTFSAQRELLGEQTEEFSIEIPGGPFSDGTFFNIASAPHFVEGHRYLVFLRAGDWYLTPATNWFHSTFRVLTIDGKEYFVDQDGHGISAFTKKSAFVAGPMIETDFKWDTTPSDSDSGVMSSRSSHKLSKEEIIENAAKCMTVEEVVKVLEANLPSKPQNPNLQLSPALPLSKLKAADHALEGKTTELPKPGSNDEIIGDPEPKEEQ